VITSVDIGVKREEDFNSMSDDDKRSNRVQQLREDRLLSKAELARRAGVSVLTIDRVEEQHIWLKLGGSVVKARRAAVAALASEPENKKN